MGQFGAGIKSIQQGTETITSVGAPVETITNDVTITAVVMAKSVVIINGTSDYASMGYGLVAAYLTSTTNLRIVSRHEVGAAGKLLITGWQVIEYY